MRGCGFFLKKPCHEVASLILPGNFVTRDKVTVTKNDIKVETLFIEMRVRPYRYAGMPGRPLFQRSPGPVKRARGTSEGYGLSIPNPRKRLSGPGYHLIHVQPYGTANSRRLRYGRAVPEGGLDREDILVLRRLARNPMERRRLYRGVGTREDPIVID